ncbi:hypothetical protein [Dipodfec virus RodF1_38]|uniref:Uncharacterized protein n=1 Tax=Dipodfec virus RodF1_38 TaxID=2929296 RepID=A0A976N393_9VIRU|nr:hypothetical protein [Dipodfec virus RodF1_38]
MPCREKTKNVQNPVVVPSADPCWDLYSEHKILTLQYVSCLERARERQPLLCQRLAGFSVINVVAFIISQHILEAGKKSTSALFTKELNRMRKLFPRLTSQFGDISVRRMVTQFLS